MIALAELLAAGGRLHGAPRATAFADISYDSRLTRPGELFLALRTPRADGHDFIAAALAAGAAGVICARPPAGTIDATVIVAEDPAELIGRWAARRLAAVAPLVIGVTGSVGKTSTVRAIAAQLGQHGPVFRSRQSFNSLLGLPIALARLRDQDRYAVLELGADRFGEIARLAALFPPRVAVVTNVGAAHLDTFGTPDAVAREKGALVAALPPDGWAVLNGDDPRVAALRDRTAARVLTFGVGQRCDLRASDIRYSLDGTRFRLHLTGAVFDPQRITKTYRNIPNMCAPSSDFVDRDRSGAVRDEVLDVSIALLGEPAVTIGLAAIGAALACGLTPEQATRGLALVEPIAGRLRRLPARGGATLLDDSFSAALPSIEAALQTLRALPARRRIAVLGQPAAQGAGAEAAHAEIGALAGHSADLLICKGDWGLAAIQAARRTRPGVDAAVVHTTAAALAALPSDLGPGDLLLVKGAAEARMERVAAGLLAQPESAPALLVRQESAWHSVRAGAPDRPTWLRIDLDAIGYNIRRLREIAGVPLMVTLKADAYGHGAQRVALAALANGAAALAVATLGEARALRQAGVAAPILVLGYTPPWQAREAIGLDVICTIFDLDSARALDEAAGVLERQAIVHIKVDTGMARLGLPPEQVGRFLSQLTALGGLRVEGLYTHFASADSADETFARTQLRRFERVLAEITAAGLRPPIVHAANSAALLRMPGARFDMARPGIACYGLRPSAETPLPPDFRPALSFHTEIAQVRSVPSGTPLSYGGAFVTQRPSQIATIPVGYADGLRRAPPWREVLVREQRAPIVGRICMDYALLDVSAIDRARRGDPVVLIGAQGDQAISADEVAEWLGTISYEVVATILPRVPREAEG
jgi:alanine racemase